jgi:hypothetical protein
MPKPDKSFKFPKTLGACIDLLYAWGQERAALNRQAEQLKPRETQLTDHIFDTFSKDDLNGAIGKVAKASVIRTEVPTVKDWPKFYAYVAKNKAFDLLQRRVSSAAVRERWEAKKVVPGIEKFTALSLGLTKKLR